MNRKLNVFGRYSIIALLMLLPFFAKAQNITIKGKITDKQRDNGKKKKNTSKEF